MKRLDLSNVKKAINAARSISLRKIGREVKTAIAKEFTSNNKTGIINPKNQYAGRRSSPFQSLAKDSGQSLANLNYDVSANKVVIGIKKFTNTNGGKNYISYWENNNRPTIANALEKTKTKIYSIVETNLNSRI